LSFSYLGLAGFCLVILAGFSAFGIRRPAVYILLGVLMWAFVLKSGIHATLAGVAQGAIIPLHDKAREPLLLEHLEHALKPWVAFLIVPIFAFANAGVPMGGIGMDKLTVPLTTGIVVGLFVGKQTGIFTATWLTVRLRLSPKPAGASWVQIYGVATLAGIGFTMSLFIVSLSFTDPALQDQIRLGVIVGSLLSAVFGVLLMRWAATRSASGS
jgi:NhaA family Na+:H+ antiporter